MTNINQQRASNHIDTWSAALHLTHDEYLSRAFIVVEHLLPEWKSNNPQDTIPVRTFEAAKALVTQRSSNLIEHTKILARECSNSRKRSLGYEHRIADAVQALARVSLAETDKSCCDNITLSLKCVEEHIAYALSIQAIYHDPVILREMILNLMFPSPGLTVDLPRVRS